MLPLVYDELRKLPVADFPKHPDYRRDLGKHFNNLGVLQRNLGEHAKAQATWRQALVIRERLAADFPTVPHFRHDLADSHSNLGVLLSHVGKLADAEAAYRQALGIREKLVADFPTVPQYRGALAGSHNNLGLALADQGKRPEAEAAYRKSLDIQEKFVTDFPTVPEYAVDLGGACCNFGRLLGESGQAEAAVAWFQKAIARLEPMVAKEPRLVTAREFLRSSQWGRAQALDVLGRHAEATRDWERALELDTGSDREQLRAHLATSRLRRFWTDKDTAGCQAEAAEYEALMRTDAASLYDAARNRAICADVIRDDPNTPGADAPRLAREQADLAMAWLRKAVAAGFTDAESLKKDKDLDPLREREDFKELLTKLEARKK